MKKIPLVLAGVLLMITWTGCKKGGKIDHTIRYTTDKNAFRAIMGPEDTAYTDFGSYVTSITPYSFKAKMNIMCYQDNWQSAHMISYIDGHDNDPRFEIALYADFSGNMQVQPDPILYSTDMRDGVFEQKKVTFDYFIFVPYYINVEFVLPAAYNNVALDMLSKEYDTIRKSNICKTTEFNLIKFIFAKYPKVPGGYVFGNTDSTFIFNKEGLSMPDSKDRPFGGPNYTAPVIRSNHYSPTTVTMPDGGETIEMASTLSYNIENLIQIYAGKDNKPYTKDDMFVYAPRYWERLKVKLETH